MVKLTIRYRRDQMHTHPQKMIEQAIRLRLKKVVQLVADVATKSDRNVERIHDLRTETRRADAALRLFVDWLPRRRTERIRRHMGDIREKAGEVRDLDVQLPLLESLNQQLSVETLNWLRDRIVGLQEKKERSLKLHCRQLVEWGFTSKTRSLTHHVQWRQSGTMPSIHEFCCLEIGRFTTRFDAAVELLKSDSQQLHHVRIQGRRLRYSLDLMRDVLPESPLKVVCDKLTELQDSLGRANDQNTMLRFLNDSAKDEELGPLLNPVITQLNAVTSEQLDHIIQAALRTADEVHSDLAEMTSGKIHGLVAQANSEA